MAASDQEADDEQEQEDTGSPGSALRPLRPGGWSETAYAYAYLTLLVVLPVAALVGAVYFGVVNLEATVTLSPDLSTPAQWLAQGLVVVFLVWTLVQVVRVTGVGFVAGLMGALARIAHNYELPGEPPQENEGEDDG
jgi:ABC-type Fe3+ transport system permease subunit